MWSPRDVAKIARGILRVLGHNNLELYANMKIVATHNIGYHGISKLLNNTKIFETLGLFKTDLEFEGVW